MAIIHPLFGNEEFVADLRNLSLSERYVAEKWEYARSSVNKYRQVLRAGGDLPDPNRDETSETRLLGDSENHASDGTIIDATKMSESPWGLNEWREYLRLKGQDPDSVTFNYGVTSNPNGGYWNKLNNVRKIDAEDELPKWPVIQPGPSYELPPITRTAKATTWQTAILIADTQFGFRSINDDSWESFHDDAAINVALQIIAAEDPDQTVVMGDILDLTQQSKYTQEFGFARTTQMSIDATTEFTAQLRAATSGQIVYIEGNHDKRMQNFVEANALAAFGLRKGGMPESWPVMSIPYLLRLDEYGVIYKDAYPNSHWWINDKLRCEHGTKSNSRGSTSAAYLSETPHLSRAHGHSHRLEVQSRTTYDRLGKIRNLGINPGCLCKVDGTVPGVGSAIGADGTSSTHYENWQQGLVVVRYREGDDFFVDGLVQIDDGFTIYGGQEFSAE
jgi:predicted phosphodiesterase